MAAPWATRVQRLNGEPGRAFFAMLRFYSPGKALLDRTWVLPEIEKAK